MYEALIQKAFKSLAQGLALVESAEKRRVLRSLRVLYFFPDGTLKCLRKIVEGGEGASAAASEGRKLLAASRGDFDAEFKFLTSDSVRTNLQLSVYDVAALAEITDFKEGVRARLRWVFTSESSDVVSLAKEVEAEITMLNASISELEASLRGEGL